MTVPEPARPDLDFALDPLPDLYDVLEGFRAIGPAVPVLFAKRPLWMIVGHDAVRAALTDEAHFSTAEAYRRSLGRTMGPVMATMTGPAHRKNRGVIAPVFYPRAMQALVGPVFADEAWKLADELEAKVGEGEPVDLVRSFARRYTFNVITRLLGLPVTDVERLMGWAERIMAQGWDFPGALRAKEEMGAYLAPVVRERRRAPADDFLSLLVTAEIDGEGLGDEEVFAFCRNLFPAGIDTSTNSLGSLLFVVLHDPVVRRFALGGPDACERVVQELLRWQPPLALVPRRCVREKTLGDCTIEVGDDLMLSLASANSDPAVYAEPRRFDPLRQGSHLAFGHGEHFCIGSHMARRVLETGLATLLERFPDMAACPERPATIVHGTLRGPRALWVRLA